MTRDEWYKTQKFVKLRFLNNIAASIKMKCQEFGDVLELILMDNPELSCHDKFTVVDMQKRIVSLEASKLWDKVMELDRKLSPKSFDDMMYKEPVEEPAKPIESLGGFGLCCPSSPYEVPPHIPV